MIKCVIWDLGETINTLPPTGMDYKPLYQYPEIQLREGALEALQKVKELGYKQAVLSNTAVSDSSSTRKMLDNLGVLHFFTYVFATNSELTPDKPEKPDSSVFEHVLTELSINSNEAVMVGNTWDTDIVGANKVGMHSIWIQHPEVSHRKDITTKLQVPPWIIPVWDVADVPLALQILMNLDAQY